MALSLIVALTFAQALSAAAQEPVAEPLPGNKPCAYPTAALRQKATGPVHYVAWVTPEGSDDSVEIRDVPFPDLGFEAAVRSCVADWRFESAAAGETGLRSFEGTVRYRIAPAEEKAVRQLLEHLSTAWNTGDKKAVDELELGSDELPTLPTQGKHFLRKQVQDTSGDEKCRLELEHDVKSLRFLQADVVEVAQAFACVPAAGERAPSGASPRTLDLTAVKGPRGWRLASISEADKLWFGVQRVGESIPEPKLLKKVSPTYPKEGLWARIQGIVSLECIVSGEGKVTDVRVIRGIQLLDQAAIKAVRQWEYAPTVVDGQPIPVIVTVTVGFRFP